MLTFEEAQNYIDELCAALPPEIFKDLNCGVSVIPDITYDHNGLLTLGMYHFEPRGLGRYVTIHYGSIIAAYGYLPAEEFKARLKEVLHHELTHHLEGLAGDRSLEIEDEINVARLLARYRPQ